MAQRTQGIEHFDSFNTFGSEGTDNVTYWAVLDN